MKRIAIVCIAATVVLAAIFATTGGAESTSERTFTLIRVDESQAFGDVTPLSANTSNPRFSGGDMHVFTSKLLNEAHTNVGRLLAQCITVHGGQTFVQARFQCSATFVLRDGTITVNTAFSGNQRDEDVLSAVTGGTGVYEGARGSIAQRDLPGGRTQDTLHLLP